MRRQPMVAGSAPDHYRSLETPFIIKVYEKFALRMVGLAKVQHLNLEMFDAFESIILEALKLILQCHRRQMD